MNMVGCRVSGWCVVAQQGPSESDVCISMRYVFLICHEHVWVLGFGLVCFRSTRGRARAILAFQWGMCFVCLVDRLMAKPQEAR